MKNILKLLTMKVIAGGAKFPEASISRAVELMQLKILLDQEHINCVLDVGANKGQFGWHCNKCAQLPAQGTGKLPRVI